MSKKESTLPVHKPRNKPKAEVNPETGELEVHDPKAQLFMQYYFDPSSDSFGNVRGSGIRAGFSEEYATNLWSLMPQWLKTIIDFYRDRHERMVAKAEMVLEEIIDMEVKQQAIGAFGPVYEKKEKFVTKTLKNGKKKKVKTIEKVPVIVTNIGKLKIKQDTAKFITERLHKKKYGNQAQTANIFNTFNLTPEQMRKVAKEFTLTVPKDGK